MTRIVVSRRRVRATVAVLAALSVLSVTGSQAATSQSGDGQEGAEEGFADEVIPNHHGNVEIDLVPGADRGRAKYDLTKGTLDPQNVGNPDNIKDGFDPVSPGARDAFFVISDVSDKEFAELTGANHAPALSFGLKSLDGVEDYFNDPEFGFTDPDGDGQGEWKLKAHPGVVADTQIRDPKDTNFPLGPVGTQEYSPIKRINWNGREVMVNAPFIKWGDGPGEHLVVDVEEGSNAGGCYEEIRRNPANPFFVGGGPVSGPFNCEGETSGFQRYNGGQALALDTESENPTVTMKLHLAFFDVERLPYYVVFDASKAPPAGFQGVIHVPRTEKLGRVTDSALVGSIEQFANGIPWSNGGPGRFQPGIPNYPGGTDSQIYTPFWHITQLFFDGCESVANGEPPIPPPDPDNPRFADPFPAEGKGYSCQDYAEEVAEAGEAGNNQGILSYGDIDAMVDDGQIRRNEAPAGVPFGDAPPLVVNCPVPVTVDLDRGAVTPDGVARDGLQLDAELDGDGSTGTSDLAQAVSLDDGRGKGSVFRDFGLDLQSSALQDEEEVDISLNGETIATIPTPGTSNTLEVQLSTHNGDDIPLMRAGDIISVEGNTLGFTIAQGTLE